MPRRTAMALVALGLLLLASAPLAWLAGFTRAGGFGEAPPPAPLDPPATMTTSTVDQPVATPTPEPEPRRTPVVAWRPARLSDQSVTSERTEPLRVLVPSLGIDAPVEPVGVVAGTGELEIPDDVHTAGWYRFGAAPGAREGSAVLTSHVDSRRQGPGAFAPLVEVTEGAEVTVELAGRSTLAYRVIARQRYAKERLPTSDLFARDGGHRLVLITCGGPFDATAGRYRDNVVVIAVPVRGP